MKSKRWFALVCIGLLAGGVALLVINRDWFATVPDKPLVQQRDDAEQQEIEAAEEASRTTNRQDLARALNLSEDEIVNVGGVERPKRDLNCANAKADFIVQKITIRCLINRCKVPKDLEDPFGPEKDCDCDDDCWTEIPTDLPGDHTFYEIFKPGILEGGIEPSKDHWALEAKSGYCGAYEINAEAKVVVGGMPRNVSSFVEKGGTRDTTCAILTFPDWQPHLSEGAEVDTWWESLVGDSSKMSGYWSFNCCKHCPKFVDFSHNYKIGR